MKFNLIPFQLLLNVSDPIDSPQWLAMFLTIKWFVWSKNRLYDFWTKTVNNITKFDYWKPIINSITKIHHLIFELKLITKT
jgi:hypothetical protein